MTPQQVGWLGAVFLASAGIPQAIKVVREGHAEGMAGWYLTLLWLGFFSMVVFTLRSHAPAPMMVSYYLQLFVFSVIAKYKVWPRTPKEAPKDEMVR